LARRSRVQPLSRGAALVRRGEPLPGFCALVLGALKLALPVPHRGERVLALVTRYATFGEAAALRRQPSSCDIVALADAAVLVLPVAAVETLAEQTPRFARNLIEILAERALELQAEVEAGVLQSAPQRLAAYLAALARGTGGRGPCTVQLPVSKTLLAAILGIKKETLSRLLRDLVERRQITLSRDRVTINDPDHLGALQ
jgi:CRP-like cAMP-binding protein